MQLVGTPSDDVRDILATGGSNVTTAYVSMSTRDPMGRDEHYIAWHALDHEPEQHRIASVQASRRLVSTPSCRAARAVSGERYDKVDHVMLYLFADPVDYKGFEVLNVALDAAGRTPYLLPTVERGPYAVRGMAAARRARVGADVLPWWPARGMFLLVERGDASAADLTEVAGVAGVWWAAGLGEVPLYSTVDNSGMQLSFCYLDDDPVDAAVRLRPALEKRWAETGVVPLLAAPFHTIVPYEWGRYLP